MTTATLAAMRSVCDTHTRYVAGCPGCRQRTRDRRRARYRAVAYGQLHPGRADTTEVRQHITVLHDEHGMSYRHIAYAASVRRDAVRHIADGRQQQASPRTVAAILAVTPSRTVDEVMVRRVFTGAAPIGRLGREERAELWRTWRRARIAVGEPAGPVSFARQYGITRAEAQRAQHAAERATHTTTPTTAADSRTNRKVA